jgi:hypothetical protein
METDLFNINLNKMSLIIQHTVNYTAAGGSYLLNIHIWHIQTRRVAKHEFCTSHCVELQSSSVDVATLQWTDSQIIVRYSHHLIVWFCWGQHYRPSARKRTPLQQATLRATHTLPPVYTHWVGKADWLAATCSIGRVRTAPFGSKANLLAEYQCASILVNLTVIQCLC